MYGSFYLHHLLQMTAYVIKPRIRNIYKAGFSRHKIDTEMYVYLIPSIYRTPTYYAVLYQINSSSHIRP